MEDFTKICPKTFNQCVGVCHKASNAAVRLYFTDTQSEWHKVFDLQSLFDILSKSGDKPYMLVGGNTAHGIVIRFI